MKKTLIAATLALILAPVAQAELFISEYVEGSSNNKALELYNPGTSAINLSDYRIRVYSNGALTSSVNQQLSGSLAAGETFIYAASNAAAAILAVANVTTGSGLWNGNDAIVIEKNGEVVDSFGRVGENPGTAWTGNGVTTIDKTLRRKSVLRDTNISDAFDPSVEWIQFDRDDFSDLGMFNGTGAPIDPEEPVDPEPLPPLVCGATFTPISAIQGAGNVSPLIGQTVVVEAVVTHTLPGLRGYMIQASDLEQDTDPLTSEGVFVFTDNANLNVTAGQRVRLQAQVAEAFSNTQLQNVTQSVACGTAELPSAVTVSLPVAALDYLERYEGMLVQFAQELTVNSNFTLGRFGELVLSNGRRYTPTQVVTPGAAAQALAAEHALNRIMLDDASTVQNAATVIYPAPGLTAMNTVRAGDTVVGLTGTLYYSFNEYRVNPINSVNFVATNPRTAQPELSGDGNVKIASFNVLNYFNGDGLGGGFPTARGANNLFEFERQRAKILAALAALDATVIGVMEIENDGFTETSAIADLVRGLQQVSGQDDWRFVSVNTPVIGTDQITVGMLYRANLATPVGDAQVLDESNSATDANGVALFNTRSNRPMLAQRFKLTSNNAEFAVMVNHLKSKGSACSGDPDLNDGQGNCNITRTRAAEAVGQFAAQHFNAIPALVIGDLNSYAKEDPLTALAHAGYANVFDVLEKTPTYGYVFDGLAGQLDHALLNEPARRYLVDAAEWHINADEPISLDYNQEFKSEQQRIDFYAPDAYRSSDHDPVIVALDLIAPLDIDLNLIKVNQGNAKSGSKLVQLRWSSVQTGLTLYRDGEVVAVLDKPGQYNNQFKTSAPAVTYTLCYDATAQCSAPLTVQF
ncbi:ExeM/NucH family extracellular endonuclease [Rheinheimera sp. UJ63]|uniref:ExeM/NucH family extracellular endonuclease n=1 Tax=Rheinheimera sp. UJ63 TaxID=2910157 RepID=UPI001F3C4121|nr:ExeM/NucH family extracellular endonuclease [Rheinheimera sp. UJ63]MCF4009181.1 ExeM/NucH family extracellular endonuclease [Rheinheimera sp. UJ63]